MGASSTADRSKDSIEHNTNNADQNLKHPSPEPPSSPLSDALPSPRKRPRLASPVGTAPPSSPISFNPSKFDPLDASPQVAAAAAGSPDLPKKVILNLRTSQTSPDSSSGGPLATHTMMAASDGASPSESSPTTFVNITSDAQRDPSPVDLVLADSDDVSSSSSTLDVLDPFFTFPTPFDSRTPLEATKLMVSAMDGQNPPGVPIQHLNSLGNWLESFIRLFDTNPSSLTSVWASTPALWRPLAALFSRLLDHKEHLPRIASPQHILGTDTRPLTNTLVAYYRFGCLICRTLAAVNAEGIPKDQLESFSSHISNMRHVLQWAEGGSLRIQLVEAFDLKPEDIEEVIAFQLAGDDLVNSLVGSIAAITATAPPCEALTLMVYDAIAAFKALLNSCNLFARKGRVMSTEPSALFGAASAARDDIEHGLLRFMEHANSHLEPQTFIDLALKWSQVLYAAALLSRVAAPDPSDPHLKAAESHANAEKTKSLLTVCWKAITQTRISIRVAGVKLLGVAVDNLLRANGASVSPVPPAVQLTIRFIHDHNIVEYLLGEGAHPHLISHIANTLRLLNIRREWRSSMTEAAITLACHSRDTSKVATLVTSLSAAAPDMDFKVSMSIICGLEDSALSSAPGSCMSLLKEVSRCAAQQCGKGPDDRKLELYHSCLRHATTACATLSGEVLLEHGTCLTGLIHDLAILCRLTDKNLQTFIAVCVSNFAKIDSVSMGSVLVLLGVLHGQPGAKLLQKIVQEASLERRVPDLCDKLNVADSSNFGKASVVWTVCLLRCVLPHVSNDFINSSQSTNLWSTLVGANNSNESLRLDAWGLLIDLACFNPPCAVVTKFADQDLASLAPDRYTYRTVQFAHSAAQHMWQDMPTPTEGAIISVPLEGVFWSLMLDTPAAAGAETVALAKNNLCEYFTVAFSTKDWPLSSLSATHAALVEKSLVTLREAAATLRHGTITYTSERHFVRVLDFLSVFLDCVRRECRFRTTRSSPTPPRHASPGDEASLLPNRPSEDISQNEATAFALQYQASDFEQQTLQVGEQSTYADIHRLLQQQLPFNSFKTYCQGRPLDLLLDSTKPATSLKNVGLILVQNVGTEICGERGRKDSVTIAESTLMNYCDELYELLNLEGLSVEKAAFDFLAQLPHCHRTARAVLSGSAQPEDCFHPTKHFKTVYELQCLRDFYLRHQDDQVSAGKFLSQALQFTLNAIAQPSVCLLHADSLDHGWTTHEALLTVDFFLKHLPNQDMIPELVVDFKQLNDKLISTVLFTQSLVNAGVYENVEVIASIGFDLIRTLTQHSAAAWESFSQHEHSLPMIKWLLVLCTSFFVQDKSLAIMRTLIRSFRSCAAGIAAERRHKIWQMIMTAIKECIDIGVVPMQLLKLLSLELIVPMVEPDTLKKQFSHGVAELLQVLANIQRQESMSRSTTDQLVLGLAECGIAAVEADLVPNSMFDNEELLRNIFEDLLFPDIDTDPSAGNTDLTTRRIVPVVESTARDKLGQLLVSLCRKSQSISLLVGCATSLVRDATALGVVDLASGQEDLLRSSAGYSGLRNLSNTCYMNSLVTQLFMNTAFRKFVLELPFHGTAKKETLVPSLQRLFTGMLTSHSKYIDTLFFASSIVPYDGNELDVSIQMDVDEFFNLLLDRVEAQLPSKQHRDALQNMLQGNLLTQIKSKNCEHISERTEPYLTLSCDVRGKTDLTKSLQAYVDGDTMEGENKYKCEACNGRFVDAVKRTCLKTVPDHLTIHLKRFDFDLQTMTRSKINDRFEFPMEIDMAPYKYDTLDAPDGASEPDIFQLVGILIHLGSAETGHYYSLIRNPTAPQRWLEFNDTEVTDFKVDSIPDEAFGSSWEYGAYSKSNSAYMLFYERCTPASKDAVSQASASKTVLEMHAETQKLNGWTARWHCLLDPSYATFIKASYDRLAALTTEELAHGASRSEVEVAKREMNALCLDYLAEVALRGKDETLFDTVWTIVTESIQADSSASKDSLEWFSQNESSLSNLLLQCPSTQIRRNIVVFVLALLHSVRDDTEMSDATCYGTDIAAIELETAKFYPRGLLSQLVAALVKLGGDALRNYRRYNEYFDLLTDIGTLGLGECRVLLEQNVLHVALLLLYATEQEARVSPSLDHFDYWRNNAALASRIKHNIDMGSNCRLIALLLSKAHAAGFLSSEETGLLVHYLNTDAGRVSTVMMLALEHTDDFEKSELWPPAVVMDYLLTTLSSADQGRIAVAIALAAEEHSPAFNAVTLEAAKRFLQSCSKAEDSKPIWVALVRRMTNFTADEASDMLELLEFGVGLKSATCSTSPDEKPFTELGVAVLGSIGPILISTSAHVCEKAAELVHLTIKQPLARALQAGTTPTALDRQRQAAAAEVLGCSSKMLVKGIGKMMSKRRLEQLAKTTRRMWTWFNNMAQDPRDTWQLWQDAAAVDFTQVQEQGRIALESWKTYVQSEVPTLEDGEDDEGSLSMARFYASEAYNYFDANAVRHAKTRQT